jgi:hypothetical protein
MDKKEGHPWAPIGCFSWRGRGFYRTDIPPIMKELESEVATAGENLPLLKAGLFAGSLERFYQMTRSSSRKRSRRIPCQSFPSAKSGSTHTLRLRRAFL